MMAIYATALATVAIMYMMPDLTSAGAAASLIFLLAFALTHVTAYLARKRGGPVRARATTPARYRTPMFPLVPIVGGLACAGLSVFQALAVPEAGKILLIWLGMGVMLYISLFKGRAEAADASAEGLDPRLNLLRGKNPLVLLPIANPRNARSLVEIANALAPSEFARVLLLSIIRARRGGTGDPVAQLADAQEALRQALSRELRRGQLAGGADHGGARAVDRDPSGSRASTHCESMLIGLPKTISDRLDRELEDLLNTTDCDLAMMRAPDTWRIGNARRVLVPVAGKSDEYELRARLLATLSREVPRELVFLHVVPGAASDDDVASAGKLLGRLSRMRVPGTRTVEVVRSDDPTATILAEAARCDLVVLGMRTGRFGRKMLGTINRRIAAEAECAVMLLSRRPQTQMSTLVQPIRDVAQSVPLPFITRRTIDDE